MPLSMYQASVPVFLQGLAALAGILDKAAAHAAARGIDPGILLQARLAPDMFPFVRQVQVAADAAKGAAARLAGVAVPTMPDTEASFGELKARLEKTTAFVRTCDASRIDGSEDRDVTVPGRGGDLTFKSQAYLLHFALPNFFFHLTTAYAILRHNGIEVGKRDFLGPLQ